MNSSSRIRFILFAFCSLLFSQFKATTKPFLDSVSKVFESSSTSLKDKMNALYTLSYEYGLIEPRKGIAHGFKLLKLALEHKNVSAQVDAYNGIANAYETMSDFDSALYYHRLSHSAAIKMKSDSKKALTLCNTALCLKQKGEYKTALKEFLSAYQILEKQKSYNPRLHYYISDLYLRTGEYNQAEFHSRLGIIKCLEFDVAYVVPNMYINLSRCFIHKKETDSALFFLDKALNGLIQQTDQASIAICLRYLGELYLIKNNFNKALRCFNDELAYRKKMQDYVGAQLAYANLALAVARQNPINRSSAYTYLREAQQRNSTANMPNDLKLEYYQKMALAFEKLRDSEKSLAYYKRYFVINDSLLNLEEARQIAELQTKYEAQKKEKELVLLRKNDKIKTLEIETQSHEIRNRNIIIILVALLLVSTGYLFFVIIKKNKQQAAFEKEIAVKQAEESERLRMAKDLHDDLGSGLSKINFLTELMESHQWSNPEIKQTFNSISDTSKKLIGNMRDLVWVSNPENITLDGLISRIREYSSDYLEEFSPELEVKFTEDVPQLDISKESYRNILMIVKESLNNVVKHSGSTLVAIEIIVSNQHLTVCVKDNGKGIDRTKTSGNGLKNMKSRTEALGGIFSIEVDNGTGILINIPVERL